MTVLARLGTAIVIDEVGVLPWRSVAAGALFGASLLLLDASGLLIGGPGTVVMWLGLTAVAGAAAFTLDDPSIAVTSVAPVRPAVRLVARLLLPVGLLGIWMAYVAVVVHDTDAGLSAVALSVTGSGVVLLSLGTAALVRVAGLPEPGALVAPVVLLAVTAGLALPLAPGRLQLLLAVEAPGRELLIWGLLMSVQLGALVRAGLDPWQGRRRLGSFRP